MYITNKLPTLSDIYFVHGFQLAFEATPNLDVARVDVSLDGPIRGDRKSMLAEVDCSFHFSIDGQVLLAKEVSFDQNSFPIPGPIPKDGAVDIARSFSTCCEPRLHVYLRLSASPGVSLESTT